MKSIYKYKYLITIAVLFASFLFLTFKNTFGLRTIMYLDTKIHSLDYVQNTMVVQKSDSGLTRVNFSGRVGLFADNIEALAIDDSVKIVGPDEWKQLNTPSSSFFTGNLDLKEGIQKVYLRSIKYKKSDISPRLFNLIKLGVGEVFIIAGQSNASGGSKTLFCSNSGNVFCSQLQEDGNFIWKDGNDPQIAGGGGSVWPLVGDSLSKLLHPPIGFINIAVGSSSINDWNEGGFCFQQLADAIESCGPNGARAILWHQGETDIYMPSQEYYEKLSKIIKSSQKKMQKPIPWVVSTASFQGGKTSMPIRKAQKLIVKNSLALEGPDTDTLKLSYREAKDKVHFNKKGTIAASNLWIDAIMKSVFKK
jgi:hypothetical protein